MTTIVDFPNPLLRDFVRVSRLERCSAEPAYAIPNFQEIFYE